MFNIATNVAMVILMFVWDRTIGSVIPLSVLDRMLTRGNKVPALKM
jgi:hypothetical protein